MKVSVILLFTSFVLCTYSMNIFGNSSSNDDVICPDAVTVCDSTDTCCISTDTDYSCCPIPQAVCCDDHIHCCPTHYKCDLKVFKCDREFDQMPAIPMMKKRKQQQH